MQLWGLQPAATQGFDILICERVGLKEVGLKSVIAWRMCVYLVDLLLYSCTSIIRDPTPLLKLGYRPDFLELQSVGL